MTSKLKIAVAAAGVLTLAATAAVAAIGLRSYKRTGSVIPQTIRNIKAADLRVGGCPVFSARAVRHGDDDEL